MKPSRSYLATALSVLLLLESLSPGFARTAWAADLSAPASSASTSFGGSGAPTAIGTTRVPPLQTYGPAPQLPPYGVTTLLFPNTPAAVAHGMPLSLQAPNDAVWHGNVQLAAGLTNWSDSWQAVLRVDGRVVQSASRAPVAFTLDTAQYPDGQHEVRLAVEEHGLPVGDVSRLVTFANLPPAIASVEVENRPLAGESVSVRAEVREQASPVDHATLWISGTAVAMQRGQDGAFRALTPPLKDGDHYRVEVVDRAGNVAVWPQKGEAALAVYTPDVPLQLDAAVTDGPAMKLTWPAIDLTGGMRYVVYRTGPDGTQAELGSVEEARYVDTTVLPGTVYTYQVAVRGRSGHVHGHGSDVSVRVPQEAAAGALRAAASGPYRSVQVTPAISVAFQPTLSGTLLAAAAPSTSVSGTISSNTTWTLANSPYVVTSSVTVAPGATLTIEAGTIVKFSANTSLNVSGSLYAVGQSASPIIFTSYKDDANGGPTNGTPSTPAAGDWANIQVGTGGVATLGVTQALYGGGSIAAIYSTGGTINASGITVQYSAARGVHITDGSVANSTISSFATTGIYVNAGSPSISGNTISGGNYGIVVNAGTPSITNNQVTGSGTAGVYFSSASNDIAGTFTGNTISGGKSYAVDLYISGKNIGNWQVGSNTFTNNSYNGYGLGGSFSGTSTLPPLDYPYVTHGVSVGSGATLNVSAGTLFKVVSSTFSSYGTLNLNGTTATPIIFTSIKDDTVFGDTNNDGTATKPAAGDWSYLEAASGGTINLQQVTISYGGSYGAAVYSSGGVINATGITVQFSGSRGVQLNAGSVSGSTISGSASTGIYVNGGSPNITGSTISGGNYGIYVNAGNPSITNNQISGSGIDGVCFNGTGSNVTGTVTGNTISGAKSFPVELSLSGGGVGNLQVGSNTFTGSPANAYGLTGSFGGTTTLPILDLPYVPNGLSVSSGATLTVQAGTIFKVASGASFRNRGTLNLNGTAASPIIFTSLNDNSVGGVTNNGTATPPAVGDWSGITLYGGSLTATNVIVRYGAKYGPMVDQQGGTANLSAITLTDAGDIALRLVGGATVSNLTTQRVGTGVRVVSGSPTISNSSLTANTYGVYVDGATPTVSGNTINAGSDGVYINESSPVIQNNTITGGQYGIYSYSYFKPAQPTLTGNVISGASSAGVYVFSYNLAQSGLTLTNNTVKNGSYAVYFSVAGIGSNTISGNTYTGNQHNGYGISSTLSVSSALYPLEYPWVVGGYLTVPSGVTVSFNPGVIAKVVAGVGLSVSGELDLRGTSSQPVVITSEKDDSWGGHTNGGGTATLPAAGDWGQITVYGTLNMDNAKVLYGGYSGQADISVTNATLQATNSEIAYSASDGVYVYGDGPTGSSVGNTSVHDNGRAGLYLTNYVTKFQVNSSDLNHNGSYGIYTLASSPILQASTIRNNPTGVYNMNDTTPYIPTLRNSNIIGNSTGIYNWSGKGPVDARFNWWGSDSGPAPGAIVGYGVAVGPWIGREYQDARLFGNAWWTWYNRQVNMVTGDWTTHNLDLTISGGKGFPIEINRTYHSLSWANGSLGYLWTFAYDLGVKNEPSQNRVTVTYGTGQEARFTANADGSYSPPPGETNHLVKNADSSWTLTTKDHSTFNFDAQGRATQALDKNGNALTFGYGTDGRLASMTDAGGRQVTFTRDSAGRITQIKDPANRTVSYGYDANGNLSTFTDVMGLQTTYTYDGDHRLLTVKGPDGVYHTQLQYDSETRVATVADGLGNKTTYSYDPTNRAVTVTDPRGNKTTTVYDANLRILTVTDPLSYKKTMSYDAANNVISVQNEAGGITSTTYDTHSNVTSRTDAAGKVTNFTYDGNDNPLTVTDPLGGVTTYTYDAKGNRTSTKDALNNTTTYTYDASGLLTLTTDPLGAATAQQYDAYGNVTQVTDALYNIEKRTYDTVGRMLYETDPLGGVTGFQFDAAGHVLTKTDPMNNVTSYQYDVLGRQVQTTDALQHVTKTTYDAQGHVIQVTDAALKSTTYAYDAAGNKASMTDPLGAVTQYAYSARNELTQVTDPLGHATLYTYDANKNRVTEKDPIGNTTTYSYDALNRKTGATFPDTTTQAWTYDALGHQLTATDETKAVTSYTYDLLGHLTKQTDPDGVATSYTYDADGRTISKTDAQGTTTYTLDQLGRATTVTNALYQATTYAYDANSRRTTMTDPLGNVTQYAYDADGHQVKVTDPLGNATTTSYDAIGEQTGVTLPNAAAWTYGYDAVGRLQAVTEPKLSSTSPAVTTTYSYDPNGHLTASTNGNTQTTAYTYDAGGNLTKLTDPLSHSTSYTYDADNNRLTMVDPNGVTTSYAYDNRNRLTSEQAGSTITISFTYDAAGRRATMTDASGKTSYLYTTAGRLKSQTTPDTKVISYSYDTLGRLTSTVDYTGATIGRSYDGAGRLTQVQDADGSTAQYSYDAAGRRSQLTLPGGITVSYGYDVDGHITQVAAKRTDASVVGQYSYAYDTVGNVTSRTDGTGTTSFSYDPLQHLSSFTKPDASSVSYTYDNVGNRLTETATPAGGAPGAVVKNYSYDAANRLTSVGTGAATATYSYDGNGNLLSDGTNTYGYDTLNRLVSLSGATTASYAYNGDGLRILSTVNGTTSAFYWDGDQIALEASGGQMLARNVYGLERISRTLGPASTAYQATGNNRAYYLHDGHGDVRALLDPTGAVIGTYAYDAWGTVVSSTGSFDNPYRYAGEYQDAGSNQYYLRARFYQPGIGRFITQDTYTGDSSDPGSLNLYTYVQNDPLEYSDPSGHCPWCITGIAGALLGGGWGAYSSWRDTGRVDWGKVGEDAAVGGLIGLAAPEVLGEGLLGGGYLLGSVGLNGVGGTLTSWGISGLGLAGAGLGISTTAAGSQTESEASVPQSSASLAAQESSLTSGARQTLMSGATTAESAASNEANVAQQPQILQNAADGARREAEVYQQLQEEYPNAQVYNQRLLRNADHSKAIDEETGEGRRLDHVVVQDGKVIRAVETTSPTADKALQVDKTTRILRQGQTYIRIPGTKTLLPLNVPVEIRRIP